MNLFRNFQGFLEVFEAALGSATMCWRCVSKSHFDPTKISIGSPMVNSTPKILERHSRTPPSDSALDACQQKVSGRLRVEKQQRPP